MEVKIVKEVKMSRCLAAIFLLAVALSVPVAGQQAAVTSAVIDAPQLLLDLKALSADDMEGRLVGSPGGAKARAFVIERFKASGIKPFGDSYEQPFSFTARGAAG